VRRILSAFASDVERAPSGQGAPQVVEDRASSRYPDQRSESAWWAK
jgi:hypothetical protein